MTLHEWLVKKDACEDAMDWIRAEHPDATMAELWDVCPDTDWMIWALVRSDNHRHYWSSVLLYVKAVVKTAAICADSENFYAVRANKWVLFHLDRMEAAVWKVARWVVLNPPEAERAWQRVYGSVVEIGSSAVWAMEQASMASSRSAAKLQQANSLRQALGNPFTGWSPEKPPT